MNALHIYERTTQADAHPHVALSALSQVWPTHEVATFAVREILQLAGKAAGLFYRLIDGEALLTMDGPDGKKAAVGLIGPGDLIGLPEGRINAFTVQALTPVVVERVRIDSSNTTIDFLARQLAGSLRRNARLGGLEASRRLADFLSGRADAQFPEMELRCSSSAALDLFVPLKRWELASYLWMSAETLSRELRALRNRKLIETPSSQIIRLLDREGLRDL